MRARKINLSQETYDMLLEELRFLTTKRRKEIALRFKEALEQEGFPGGDIIDEELFVESRIKTINKTLTRAQIIQYKETNGDRIGIGSHLILKDLETEEKMGFTLVSSVESDLTAHRLSEESPVGKAIKDKRAGQVVRAKAPHGEIKYKILVVGKEPESVLPKVS